MLTSHWRIAGYILLVLSIILLSVVKYFSLEVLIPGYDVYGYIKSLYLFALFFLMVSKEKGEENENIVDKYYSLLLAVSLVIVAAVLLPVEIVTSYSALDALISIATLYFLVYNIKKIFEKESIHKEL